MDFWQRFINYATGAAWRTKGIQTGSGGHTHRSAVPVTIDSALQLSSVWACVKIITESMASLPVEFFRKDPKTGICTPWPDHPLALLFSGAVNSWQTRVEYLESIIYQQVLLGNSYTAVQRITSGKIIGLVPLMNSQMQVTLLKDGSIVYLYTDGGNVNVYAADSIWHNKQFGNGVIGLSTLSYARNTVGIGLAAEQTVTKIYNNGGKPSGILSMDKLLTPEQRAQVKLNFKELTEGDNSRLFVLEAGAKYDTVSLSPQDMELLASRKYQIEEIARFFGVPSVLINDTGANTAWGSGIQQLVEGFYKFGLRPALNRMAASMMVKLVPAAERPFLEIRFNPRDLLTLGEGERVIMYKNAVQGGLMTPNEARNCEGRPPLAGGDDLLVQRQMVALSQLNDITDGALPNVQTYES